jgi:hypothetical protein
MASELNSTIVRSPISELQEQAMAIYPLTDMILSKDVTANKKNCEQDHNQYLLIVSVA